MKRVRFLMLLGSLGLGLSAHASIKPLVLNFNQSNGKVQFRAIGRPAFVKIDGHGVGPTGQLTLNQGKLNGTFQFQLNSLKTGISLRDYHMKEKYLKVQNFPVAALSLKHFIVPPQFFKGKTASLNNLPFTGKLKLDSADKPVTGTVDLARKQNQISLRAKFALNLKHFGIAIPSYLGITVAKTVKVKVAAKTDIPTTALAM